MDVWNFEMIHEDEEIVKQLAMEFQVISNLDLST
jgi:hypothetical protein